MGLRNHLDESPHLLRAQPGAGGFQCDFQAIGHHDVAPDLDAPRASGSRRRRGLASCKKIADSFQAEARFGPLPDRDQVLDMARPVLGSPRFSFSLIQKSELDVVADGPPRKTGQCGQFIEAVGLRLLRA